MNIFIKLLNLIKLWVILILILSSSSQANLLNENKLNYKADLLFGDFNDKQNYLLAGVKVKLDNNWKIYWKNPGEAGLPPKIIFDKISNVSNVNLLFPEPKSFKFFNIDTFGYDKEIIFPLKIYVKNPEKIIFGNLKFNAQICNQICVPIEENFKLNYFPINSQISNSSLKINEALNKVPKLYNSQSNFFKKIEINNSFATLYFTRPISSFRIIIENKDNFIFPQSYQTYENIKNNFIKFKIPAELKNEIKNDQLKINFFSNEMNFFYDFPVKDFWSTEKTYLYFISIALLAGFILNFMPCVLPVLSLKIANFISTTNSNGFKLKRKIFNQILGIITSFFILFLTISFFRKLGNSITWGFQFQNDYFLLIISLIIFLLSFNLFGFYELRLPFKLNQTLSRLNYKKYEDFLSGCLLTILATPCTAPFVGTAVIFALSGSYFDSFLIFFFMSIGMSIPLFLVLLNPYIFNFFPKSGKWLLYFKKLMAVIFMLSGLWFFSIFLNNNFNNIFTFNYDSQINWKTWDLEKDPNLIKDLVSENKTVFLDITADWCITCQYNKLNVLNDKDIKEVIKKNDVILLQLDWTKKDLNIKNFLISKDRYGIPYNEIYNFKFKEGLLLPELLNKKQLINILNQ